jgi:hypothetical protein
MYTLYISNLKHGVREEWKAAGLRGGSLKDLPRGNIGCSAFDPTVRVNSRLTPP